MAKQIIILEKISAAPLVFRFVLWAEVPAARQVKYANANAVSAYKDASAPEIVAIQVGQIAERVETLQVDVGTPVAQIKTTLQGRFTGYQAEITAANPWNVYGTFFDGTSWTTGGVS